MIVDMIEVHKFYCFQFHWLYEEQCGDTGYRSWKFKDKYTFHWESQRSCENENQNGAGFKPLVQQAFGFSNIQNINPYNLGDIWWKFILDWNLYSGIVWKILFRRRNYKNLTFRNKCYNSGITYLTILDGHLVYG